MPHLSIGENLTETEVDSLHEQLPIVATAEQVTLTWWSHDTTRRSPPSRSSSGTIPTSQVAGPPRDMTAAATSVRSWSQRVTVLRRSRSTAKPQPCTPGHRRTWVPASRDETRPPARLRALELGAAIPLPTDEPCAKRADGSRAEVGRPSRMPCPGGQAGKGAFYAPWFRQRSSLRCRPLSSLSDRPLITDPR